CLPRRIVACAAGEHPSSPPGHAPSPGAANNQLGVAEDGERLRDAGILFAPDFVINAGGVIHLAGSERLGWDDARTAKRLEAIGDTLLEIFEMAERDGISTAAAADRLARARIAVARG
ncbi:MAG: hypothetical protein ACR2L4_08550, partial [Actinomycetota bacterium]